MGANHTKRNVVPKSVLGALSGLTAADKAQIAAQVAKGMNYMVYETGGRPIGFGISKAAARKAAGVKRCTAKTGQSGHRVKCINNAIRLAHTRDK